MKTQAIIAAGGIGERLGSAIPKPFVEIKGKPILVHTCAVFEKCAEIDSVIVVVHPDGMEQFSAMCKRYGLHKVAHVVPGGTTRTASVLRGLDATDADTEMVVVHDAARPLIEPQIVDEAVRLCATAKAVVVGVPVKSTIKQIDPARRTVVSTPERNALWEIQTPQVFHKKLLRHAYDKAAGVSATDDAALVEKLGVPVKILEGQYKNIKITTQEDLSVAEALWSD